MNKYDAIVIGAGATGLLAALTLSKHGKKVLVLEKNNQVGGNCNSYDVDGFQVDTGPHAITHLKAGPLKRLMENYFDYLPVFEDYGNYFVRTESNFLKVPSNLKEFAVFDALPRKDRLLIAQTFTKELTLSTFGVDLSKKSVYDALPKTLSTDSYNFVDAISHFLSGKSMKETSVHRILTGSSFVRDSITQAQFASIVSKPDRPPVESILQSIIPANYHNQLQLRFNSVSSQFSSLGRLATNRANDSQGYPRKGLKALLNAILYSLPDSVDIKTESKAKKILVENNQVTGVESDEIYLADIVIHTGFVKHLPELVQDLPHNYIEELDGIVNSKSLTVWLGLDETRKEFNYRGSEIWFKDNAYWAMPISNYDPTLAPPGKQLVGFAFAIDDSSPEKKEIKKAHETIYKVVPDIQDHVEMQHDQVTIPEKAAVTINGHFAGIRTPVRNLYVAGTDTDSRSMGVTRAAYSIIEMLRILNEDSNLH
jgi:phytoene dehydrogenase-like protein